MVVSMDETARTDIRARISITTTKAYLLRCCIDVRLDSHVDYAESEFSLRGRIARHTDEHLQAQFWEYHPPEII